VLNNDLSVDEKATVALRAKLTKERGEIKLFNFGGTIAELKARCKAETSFDPPAAPVFQKWHQVAAQKLREAAE
jgi:N-methylhydantoinase B